VAPPVAQKINEMALSSHSPDGTTYQTKAVDRHTYRILQRHRAVSLLQHSFLVGLCCFADCSELSVKKWQVL